MLSDSAKVQLLLMINYVIIMGESKSDICVIPVTFNNFQMNVKEYKLCEN